MQVVSVEVSDAVVAVRARTRSGEPVGCTECGQLSEWCHSRYVRRLVDVTLAGRPLRIDLSVRRLYCENTNGLRSSPDGNTSLKDRTPPPPARPTASASSAPSRRRTGTSHARRSTASDEAVPDSALSHKARTSQGRHCLRALLAGSPRDCLARRWATIAG
ncbi:transposase family protein [Streptomyces sp. NBC_00059]|uniref:transposase family protein n=1 Tax=Streptomyces sp. NBC_00059 TaxID=2975635 RepID=UPI002B1D6B40|nr:transposase family protein [Streptomyces sp. NBC_00059]